MDAELLYNTLVQAHGKWALVRINYENLVLRVGSVEKGIDGVTVMGKLIMSESVPCPPHDAVLLEQLPRDPNFFAPVTLVLDPDHVNAIAIFKNKAGPVHDD